MIDKAIDVATQEKARYFAERIARTEKARAYMDGQCTHMPMIPTVWLSGGNFRAAIHAMTFVTCTHTDLWGMDEGIFQNDCWHHAGKAPMAFKEKGSSDFSGIPKHMGGAMKQEIMIHSQDQILRVFLYFSIRKPSISVIIIAI